MIDFPQLEELQNIICGVQIKIRETISVMIQTTSILYVGSLALISNFREGNQLLIGCIKNPVGKATNGRDMKKENWTKYVRNKKSIIAHVKHTLPSIWRYAILGATCEV